MDHTPRQVLHLGPVLLRSGEALDGVGGDRYCWRSGQDPVTFYHPAVGVHLLLTLPLTKLPKQLECFLIAEFEDFSHRVRYTDSIISITSFVVPAFVQYSPQYFRLF